MKRLAFVFAFIFTSFSNPPIQQDFKEKASIDSAVLSSDENRIGLFRKVSEEILYFGMGSFFKTAPSLTNVSLAFSPDSFQKNESLLLAELCNNLSSHFFTQSSLKTKTVSPYSSWQLHQKHLSHIPSFTEEDRKLLLFLQNRWLAKSTGFFPSLLTWFYPCFDILVQAHPETSGATYARSPFIKRSETYKNKVEDWKKILPHPKSFPLLLTRAADLKDYLPSYFKLTSSTDYKMLEKHMPKDGSKLFVDCTFIFPDTLTTKSSWLKQWNKEQMHLAHMCKEGHLDIDKIVCIQKVSEENMGGLRLLPFHTNNLKETEANHQFLLRWISTLGLCANQIELTRSSFLLSSPLTKKEKTPILVDFLTKEDFLFFLKDFEETFTTSHPQKELMIKGSLQLLNGLLSSTEKKWDQTQLSKTKSSLIGLYFSNIQKKLTSLKNEESTLPFFKVATHIEEIHANLSSLIELLSPFLKDDFPLIYEKILTSIPINLQSFTSYGIHSSAMTSLSGILLAVKKTMDTPPTVLYGENIYYECINAAKLLCNALAMTEASEQDFQKVDVLLGQFTPVWKGAHPNKTEYKGENVIEAVQKCLIAKKGKPFTLALDCTFDLINSTKVYDLLSTFEKEIKQGNLNVICYKSGLKFDLFGMDNYCGAPFYMIHNEDSKWDSFKILLQDPALQTDTLSLNWFCLAYKYALAELELYQKYFFANTKELLNKIPASLKKAKGPYQVIPIAHDTDPSFIDITISGPFHQIKTASLVAGYLSVKCIEKGFPIFYRISTGFYHTNLTMLFDKECSTIRLTLGLDPAQVDVLADCFAKIATLNEPCKETPPSPF